MNEFNMQLLASPLKLGQYNAQILTHKEDTQKT